MTRLFHSLVTCKVQVTFPKQCLLSLCWDRFDRNATLPARNSLPDEDIHCVICVFQTFSFQSFRPSQVLSTSIYLQFLQDMKAI